jgi:aryl-alcohol dehydrogenase-like predicted oxidoreductase
VKYVRLAHCAVEISEIGLGSQNWGEQNTEREAHAQIDWALARGINFVETAEMYPAPARPATQGRTEEIIGAWLANNRQHRDKLVIASKIRGPGDGEWIRGGDPHVSKSTIPKAIDASLARLRTDHIDLYQIHWPERYVPNFGEWRFDPAKERDAVPIVEQIEAMAAAIAAGKIRAYGLSNETSFGVCEFFRVARENGLPPPASVQNGYNLVSRMADGDLAEASYRLGVPFIAYGVLAKGLLSDKFRGGVRPPDSRLVKFPRPGERYMRPRVLAAAEAYGEIANRYDMPLAGLALAFVRSRFFVSSTVIGGTSIAQLDELAHSIDAALPSEVLAEIEAVHAACPSPSAQ